jgi:hypothetical protein
MRKAIARADKALKERDLEAMKKSQRELKGFIGAS